MCNNVCMSQKTVSVGDTVDTHRGNGVVMGIDFVTYSIPIFTVELIEGKYQGERIATAHCRLLN